MEALLDWEPIKGTEEENLAEVLGATFRGDSIRDYRNLALSDSPLVPSSSIDAGDIDKRAKLLSLMP